MHTWDGLDGAWHVLAWGPPFILVALSAGITLLLGLMGADYPDAAREWVSRLGARYSWLPWRGWR